MPSTVYSVLFASASGSLSGPVDLFTTRPNAVSVLRDVVIFNGALTATSCVLRYVHGSSDIRLFRGEVPATSTIHVDGRQVLPSGQLVTFTPDFAPWSIALTGYEFV